MLPGVRVWFLAVALAAAGAAALRAQQPGPATQSVVLDRAVAVVNKTVILASDLNEEVRLSVLDPSNHGAVQLTEPQALQHLISRALIEQQISQDDIPAIEPTPKEVEARLDEIRRVAPVCVRQKCASDAGWKAFLNAQGLTEQQVKAYLRNRMEVLRFIEQRFRQGIQISDQQIETYYRDTLLPQYTQGETAPPLSQVEPRIREILLEQQVNVLFDNWLANLRQEGDVEVLDPALAAELASNRTPAPVSSPLPSPRPPASASGAKGGSR
jgi:hypothetical protein